MNLRCDLAAVVLLLIVGVGCEPDSRCGSLAGSDTGNGDASSPPSDGTDAPAPDSQADASDTRSDVSNIPSSGAQRLPAFPLRASGRWVVDAKGKRFKMSGVNWQGHMAIDRIETLDQAPVADVASRLRQFGFTAVRLTWSNEAVEKNAPLDPAYLGPNPQLVGKTYLAGLDAVVDALGAEGIVVILNNHMSDAGGCCSDNDGNMFWYTDRYPESAWIQDWKTLAKRYESRPWVAGADLRNEVRTLLVQWGDKYGPQYDWPSAAERCGNEVLKVNPNLLIVVEGSSYAKFLQGAKERPIVLSVPNRVVYSSHDYPWHHRMLDGKTDNWENPGELYAVFDEWWGYLLEENQPWTAPVWLGEFGDNPNIFTDTPQWNAFGKWLMVLMGYIALNDMDWALWNMSVSGNEGLFVQTTGAINDPIYAGILQSLIAARRGPGIAGAPLAPIE